MKDALYQFEAIGTSWQIDLLEPIDSTQQTLLLEKIQKRIADFDRHYSRFLPDSLVTQISQKKGSYVLPTDAKPLLDFYTKLYELSGGLFTPLLGQVLADAGYDSEYTLKQKKALTTPPSWESFSYDDGTLEVTENILFDFGAAGKGYLIDIVASLIERNGIKKFCIDAGGDMLRHGEKQRPLRIGLENPNDVNQAIGVFELETGSLCASAGNRRKWEDFHHIINPATLTPATNVIATWVNATQAMIADGLATALFFTDPSAFAKSYDFDYLILYNDYHIDRSTGFKAELFS